MSYGLQYYQLQIGACQGHLPLWKLNPVLLQLLTFDPEGSSRWSTLCSRELVEQVFIESDVFRN